MKTKEVVLKIREQVYVDDEPFHLSDDEAEQLIQDYSDQQNKELREELTRKRNDCEELKNFRAEEVKYRKDLIAELTRLRELLSRMAMTLEIYNTGEDVNIVTLLSEYNALNHKP